jgi:hypothetical protein
MAWWKSQNIEKSRIAITASGEVRNVVLVALGRDDKIDIGPWSRETA